MELEELKEAWTALDNRLKKKRRFEREYHHGYDED